MAPSKKIRPFDFEEGRAYSCKNCSLYIASATERFPSPAFEATNNGQADLFNSVSAVNVLYGDLTYRNMDGRPFGGRDVRCASCHTTVGWEYMIIVGAADIYRHGKVQLERNQVKGPELLMLEKP